ncbi:MAG: triose-phosphate isomerase [Chloroflexota bacterium]
MRIPLIAGNWKMNCTVDESIALVSSIRQNLGAITNVEVAVCPPFTSLKPIADMLQTSNIRVGAQDVFHEDAGAYTGEISPLMLKNLCHYCIVGHSERRSMFGDTDDLVARKYAALRAHQIVPILCIGESLEQNESGETRQVIQRQVSAVFEKSVPMAGSVLAYEPVWAIGTGRAAEPAAVNETIVTIRRLLSDLSDEATANSIRILYGGSVNPGNASAYISKSDIDGYLLGGASLKAADFCEIIFTTASSR